MSNTERYAMNRGVALYRLAGWHDDLRIARKFGAVDRQSEIRDSIKRQQVSLATLRSARPA